jgi:tetratricopeptide (TPR) repeat protein
MDFRKTMLWAPGPIAGLMLSLCVTGCLGPRETLLREGHEQLRQAAYVNAYRTFSRYIKEQPEAPEGYFFRGEAASGLELFGEAETDVVRAIGLAPDNIDFRWSHVRILSQRRDKLAEAQDLNWAERPLFAALEQSLALIQLKELDQILRIDPDNVDAHFERGKILRNRGELKEAKRDLDIAFLNAPRDPWILNERGRVLYDLGDYDGAVWQYSVALTVCDTCPWLLYNKALSLKSANRTMEAIETLRDLLLHDSLDGWGWFLLAECHTLLGENTKASREFARSAELGITEAAQRLDTLQKK